MERERRHVNQLENELKTLRTKYDDVCERITAATHQLDRLKIVLEQTSHRCEQLEKEKVIEEINIPTKFFNIPYILFYNSTSSATQKIGNFNLFLLLFCFLFYQFFAQKIQTYEIIKLILL